MSKIIFLGTGSGKTSLIRNYTALFFEFSNTNLLIDCGDGICKSLLQNNIAFNEIKNIFISHLHADHFSGISSLITQMKLNNRQNELNIFAYKSFVPNIKFFLNSTFMFKETLDFDIHFHELAYNNFYEISYELEITIKKNSHIRKKDKLKDYPDDLFNSASILIKHQNKNIFYTSDINSKDDLFLFKEEKNDIVISEASHISFYEINEAFIKLNPDKLILVHLNEEDVDNLKNLILKNSMHEKIIIPNDNTTFYF